MPKIKKQKRTPRDQRETYREVMKLLEEVDRLAAKLAKYDIDLMPVSVSWPANEPSVISRNRS